MQNKQKIETIAAVFTDHLAVSIQIALPTQIIRKGRALWKLTPSILISTDVIEEIKEQWKTWKRQSKWYRNMNMWWVRLCKQRLQKLLRQAEAENRRDLRQMENHYYECIYDIIPSAHISPTAAVKLKKF
jgi:hypothetical protein